MRLAAFALLAIACRVSGTSSPAASTSSSRAEAIAVVTEECGSCHSRGNTDDLPVFEGESRISATLAADAAQRVCAGEMPPTTTLSPWDRTKVVRALCDLSGERCVQCSTHATAAVQARSATAAVRIVSEVTGANVGDSVPAQQLKQHAPKHARSATLDPTYLLLYTLLAWEGCKTAPDKKRCMADLVRKERWSVPQPAAEPRQ